MRYDVTTPDGMAAGELTVARAGVKTAFTYKSDALFPPARLVLQFSGGDLSVGVPTPKDGGLALTKKLSPLELHGSDPGTAVRVLLVPLGEAVPALIMAPAAAPEEPSVEAEPAEQGPAPEPEPEPVCGPAPQTPGQWSPEPDPSRYFTDPDLMESARKIAGALAKSDGGDTLLAFPFSPSAPFPMLPAFRFGSAQEIGGASYLVFRVREGEIL